MVTAQRDLITAQRRAVTAAVDAELSAERIRVRQYVQRQVAEAEAAVTEVDNQMQQEAVGGAVHDSVRRLLQVVRESAQTRARLRVEWSQRRRELDDLSDEYERERTAVRQQLALHYAHGMNALGTVWERHALTMPVLALEACECWLSSDSSRPSQWAVAWHELRSATSAAGVPLEMVTAEEVGGWQRLGVSSRLPLYVYPPLLPPAPAVAVPPPPATAVEEQLEQWRREAGGWSSDGGDRFVLKQVSLTTTAGADTPVSLREVLKELSLCGRDPHSGTLPVCRVLVETAVAERLRGGGQPERQGAVVYLERPYCSGGTLYDWLWPEDGVSRPSLRQIKVTFCFLLEVLHHLHSRGVVHMDLKPSNVVRTGVTGRPCVIDFGTSKCTAGPGRYTVSMTVRNVSFAYAAPEVRGVAGAGDYVAAGAAAAAGGVAASVEMFKPADLFSIGTMLRHAVLDRGPPAPAVLAATAEGVSRAEWAAVRRAVGSEVLQLLQALVDRNPVKRPSAVMAYAQLLRCCSEPDAARDAGVDDPWLLALHCELPQWQLQAGPRSGEFITLPADVARRLEELYLRFNHPEAASDTRLSPEVQLPRLLEGGGGDFEPWQVDFQDSVAWRCRVPQERLLLFRPTNETPLSADAVSMRCDFYRDCRWYVDNVLDKPTVAHFLTASGHRCFCTTCCATRGDSGGGDTAGVGAGEAKGGDGDGMTALQVSGGLPYALPDGWCRFPLTADTLRLSAAAAAGYEFQVAYHGTKVESLGPILACGSLAKPGDHVLGDHRLGVEPDHIREGVQRRPNTHFPVGDAGRVEQFDTRQTFLSPTMMYCGYEWRDGAPVYAKISHFTDAAGRRRRVQAALEVRVRKGAAGGCSCGCDCGCKVGPETVGATERGVTIDPRFRNEDVEWYTKGEEKGAIFVVALLLRVRP